MTAMASNTVGTLVFWGRVACIFSLILVGSLRAAPEAPALETIVELARTGRNAEAIERYEALPEGVDRPLALCVPLRAATGVSGISRRRAPSTRCYVPHYLIRAGLE